ncbi:MAG: hypothetical protein V3W28_02140 [Thermoplasmata archaeon]
MPHAVFEPGNVSATADLTAMARSLIPGVEPGMGIRNIFEQRRMKRALLIQDAWLEILDVTSGIAADWNTVLVYLKLSQETDLTPGLILPVASIATEGDTTNMQAMHVEQLFQAQGTVWAPRLVGLRVVEVGSQGVTVRVHLDYEVVEVPWEQWFIMWDFLDNVTDNSLEY